MTAVAFQGRWDTGGGATQDATTSYQTFTYETVYVDTHSYNAAGDGTLAIPNTGFYLVNGSWHGAGNITRRIRLRKNGTVLRGGGASVTNGSDNFTTVAQWVGCCVAGDLIDVQGSCDGTIADTGGACTIVRLPMPFVYATAEGDETGAGTMDYDEVSDFEGWHSDTTNDTRFTVTETGDYMISACLRSTVGALVSRVYVNGVSLADHVACGPAGDNDIPMLTLVSLTAGDYVEFHHDGSVQNLDRENELWHFAMWKLPSAAAYVQAHDASDTVTDVNGSAMGLASETVDTHAFHDNATNNSRLTVPAGKNGTYLVWGGGYGTSGVVNGFWIREDDGTTYGNGLGRGGTTSTMPVACRALVAGDYVELYGYDGSSGNTKFELRLGMLRLDDLAYVLQRCPYGQEVSGGTQLIRYL